MPFGFLAFGFGVQEYFRDGCIDGVEDAFVVCSALVRSVASVNKGGCAFRNVFVLEARVDKRDVFLRGLNVRRPELSHRSVGGVV
jgi:hypothetical protein